MEPFCVCKLNLLQNICINTLHILSIIENYSTFDKNYLVTNCSPYLTQGKSEGKIKYFSQAIAQNSVPDLNSVNIICNPFWCSCHFWPSKTTITSHAYRVKQQLVFNIWNKTSAHALRATKAFIPEQTVHQVLACISCPRNALPLGFPAPMPSALGPRRPVRAPGGRCVTGRAASFRKPCRRWRGPRKQGQRKRKRGMWAWPFLALKHDLERPTQPRGLTPAPPASPYFSRCAPVGGQA